MSAARSNYGAARSRRRVGGGASERAARGRGSGSRQAVVRCPGGDDRVQVAGPAPRLPGRPGFLRPAQAGAPRAARPAPDRTGTEPNPTRPRRAPVGRSSRPLGAARHAGMPRRASGRGSVTSCLGPRQGRHRQGGQSGREGRQTPSAKATRAKARGATATRTRSRG